MTSTGVVSLELSREISRSGKRNGMTPLWKTHKLDVKMLNRQTVLTNDLAVWRTNGQGRKENERFAVIRQTPASQLGNLADAGCKFFEIFKKLKIKKK